MNRDDGRPGDGRPDHGHLHELLDTLESMTLLLERGEVEPGAAIHRLFQSAHNLKSGLNMASLTRGADLVHRLEDGLDDLRRGRQAWSKAWADVVLEVIDRLKPCLEGGDEGLDSRLTVPQGRPLGALDPREVAWATHAAAQGLGLFRLEKLFSPGLTREDFEGHLVWEDLRASGHVLASEPAWEGYAQAKGDLVVRFWFSSSQSADQLATLFFDPLIELPPPMPRFRVLVIEDDPVASEVVRRAVEPMAEVTLTVDATAGTRAFARALDEGRGFDVVICDLEMPEDDGHRALATLRADEEARGIHGLDRCHVYMNTSSRDFAQVKMSFRLQADGYFIKPLSVKKIKKRLEQNVGWLHNRRRGVP